MTARPHELFTPPALKDYPFINIVFRGDATGFKSSEDIEVAGDPKLRSKILNAQFGWPSDIAAPQLAPYEALTDETFAALASILRIKCDNWDIKERSILEYFSQKNSKYHLPDDHGREPYSREQLEAYFLARATFTKNIHWGNLVCLYNQSADDQQQAICQYFEKYHGLELEQLLAYKAKEYDIPQCLDEPVETREYEGNAYLYSEVLHKWLRDDRYLQQYRVDVVNDVYRTLIATAPTLKQALAKATAHFKAAQYALDFDHCEILQGGLTIAVAKLESAVEDINLHDYNPRPVKPIWLSDELGAEKEIAEIIRTKELTAQQIETISKYTTPIKKDDFIKTLFTVEKALGVQWNKVIQLEDALGL